MDQSTALIIQLVLGGLAGIGAIAAGITYVKTKHEHGGFIFLVLAITTWTILGHVYDMADKVLN